MSPHHLIAQPHRPLTTLSHRLIVITSITLLHRLHPITSFYDKYGRPTLDSPMFAHETSKSRKLLFKTGKIRLSGFRNRTLRFC
jgi:hypothetical protein